MSGCGRRFVQRVDGYEATKGLVDAISAIGDPVIHHRAACAFTQKYHTSGQPTEEEERCAEFGFVVPYQLLSHP